MFRSGRPLCGLKSFCWFRRLDGSNRHHSCLSFLKYSLIKKKLLVIGVSRRVANVRRKRKVRCVSHPDRRNTEHYQQQRTRNRILSGLRHLPKWDYGNLRSHPPIGPGHQTQSVYNRNYGRILRLPCHASWQVPFIKTTECSVSDLEIRLGLAGGADAAYIFEEKFSIKDLQKDVYHMATKMSEGVQRGLILRNEKACENYNTDFIYRLYSEEGKGLFSARMNVLGKQHAGLFRTHINARMLGHMQQGGSPTPFDRNMGTKMASKSVEWIVSKLKDGVNPEGKVECNTPDTVVLLGIVRRQYKFTPLAELQNSTNFE